MKIEAIDRSRLAKTEEEFLALIASDADWIGAKFGSRELRQLGRAVGASQTKSC